MGEGGRHRCWSPRLGIGVEGGKRVTDRLKMG